jgi:glycosyltransferase involved in cell wall biosynthesis
MVSLAAECIWAQKSLADAIGCLASLGLTRVLTTKVPRAQVSTTAKRIRPRCNKDINSASFLLRLRAHKTMKVTVLIITYNHALYVEQALQSVLMQQVSFDYEILISEDCSTDDTRKIITELQRNYPERVRLLLSKHNLNTNEVLTRGIAAARGEYIALLDGDDYWTSPHKLQKQVDFLDSHKECSICFHQAYNLYPDGNKVLYSNDVNYEFNKRIFTLEDILFQNFLPTCSVMFRNKLFSDFPLFYDGMFAADWFLHVLNAQYGNMGYINEVWGIRRVHEGGLISMESDKACLEVRIVTMKIIDEYLEFKYTKQMNDVILSYHYRILQLLIHQRNFKNARSHAIKHVLVPRVNKQIPLGFLITVILCPEILGLPRFLKGIPKKWKNCYLFLCRK